MNATTRRIVIGTAALSMAVSLAACGKAGDDKDSGSGGDGKTIGLLLPENKTTRYETFDRPIMEAKIKALCSDCEVKYNNAAQDSETQKKQFDALVTQGVKVIILDTVDYKAAKSWVQQAAKKDVKVVAYDRLAEGPISAYVSYDNEKIGQLQGEALVKAMGAKAKDSNVVMINGSPTDPNAPFFKKGAHSVLDKQVKKVVYEQDIPDWSADEANKKMGAAIDSLGKNGFQGVYSANDGMAAWHHHGPEEAGREDPGRRSGLRARRSAAHPRGRAVLLDLQADQAGGRDHRRDRRPAAQGQEDRRPGPGQGRQHLGRVQGHPVEAVRRLGRDQGEHRLHDRRRQGLQGRGDLHRPVQGGL